MLHLQGINPQVEFTAPWSLESVDRHLLHKIRILYAARIPVPAIRETIGRWLHLHRTEDADSVAELMQGLAHIGAIPPLQWLKQGMGIDVAGDPN